MADTSQPSQSEPAGSDQQPQPNSSTTINNNAVTTSQSAAVADINDAELEQDPDVGMAGTDDVMNTNEEQTQQQSSTSTATTAVAPTGASTTNAADTDITMSGGNVQPPMPPSRKDATLREFLSKMDDYAPIIPDAVTAHYLTLSGLPPPPLPGQPVTPNSTPPQLARLLALATQKFVADIAADAYQYSRIRAGNTSSSTTSAMNSLGIPGGQPGQGAGAGGAGVGAGGDKSGKGAGGKEAHLGQARPGYGGGGQGGSGQGRTVLTMEDLGMAVGEYGINVKRSEFYR